MSRNSIPSSLSGKKLENTTFYSPTGKNLSIPLSQTKKQQERFIQTPQNQISSNKVNKKLQLDNLNQISTNEEFQSKQGLKFWRKRRSTDDNLMGIDFLGNNNNNNNITQSEKQKIVGIAKSRKDIMSREQKSQLISKVLATTSENKFDNLYSSAQQFKQLQLKPKEETDGLLRAKYEEDKFRTTTSSILSLKYDGSHLVTNRQQLVYSPQIQSNNNQQQRGTGGGTLSPDPRFQKPVSPKLANISRQQLIKFNRFIEQMKNEEANKISKDQYYFGGVNSNREQQLLTEGDNSNFIIQQAPQDSSRFLEFDQTISSKRNQLISSNNEIRRAFSPQDGISQRVNSKRIKIKIQGDQHKNSFTSNEEGGSSAIPNMQVLTSKDGDQDTFVSPSINNITNIQSDRLNSLNSAHKIMVPEIEKSNEKLHSQTSQSFYQKKFNSKQNIKLDKNNAFISNINLESLQANQRAQTRQSMGIRSQNSKKNEKTNNNNNSPGKGDRRSTEIGGGGGYYEKLKKELPFCFSNANVSRQEVLLLADWTQKVIGTIKNDTSINVRQKHAQADEVYHTLIGELVRQVSSECNERGEFLMKIWQSYQLLNQDIIMDFIDREQRIKNEGELEIQRMKEKFQKMVDDDKSYHRSILDKNEDLKDQYNRMKIEMEQAIKLKDLILDEDKNIKNSLGKYKNEIKRLNRENKDLNFKYEKIKKDFMNQQDDEFDLDAFIGTRSRNDDSDDDSQLQQSSAPTNMFGQVQKKIIHYAEKQTEYEDLFPVEVIPPIDQEVQTDLCLVNELYNKALGDVEVLEALILEAEAKDRLILEGEMLENLLSSEDLTTEEIKRLQTMLKMSKLKEYQNSTEKTTKHSQQTIIMDESSIIDDTTTNKKRSSQLRDLVFKHLHEEEDQQNYQQDGKLGVNLNSDFELAGMTPIHQVQNLHIDINSLNHSLNSVSDDLNSQDERNNEESIEFELRQKNLLDQSKASSNQVDGSYLATERELSASIQKVSQQNRMQQQQIRSSMHKNNQQTDSQTSLDNPTKKSQKQINKGSSKQHKSQKNILKSSTPQNYQGQSPRIQFSGSASSSNNATPANKSTSKQHSQNQQYQSAGLSLTPRVSDRNNMISSNNIMPAQIREEVEDDDYDNESLKKDQREKANYQQDVHTQHNQSVEKDLSNDKEQFSSGEQQSKVLLQTQSQQQKIFNTREKQILLNSFDTMAKSKGKNNKQGFKMNKSYLKQSEDLVNPNSTPKNGQIIERQQEQIVKFMNMYKVEKKKQEDLNSRRKELEEVVQNDELLIDELQSIIISMKQIPTIASIGDMDAKLETITGKLSKRDLDIRKFNLKPKFTTLYQDQEEQKVMEPNLNNSSIREHTDRNTSRTIILGQRQNDKKFTYKGNISANPQQFRKHFIQERQNNPALQIIKKIRQNYQKKLVSFRQVIPLKSMLKQISNFYLERFAVQRETPLIKEQDMSIFVYKQFMNTFGNSKFALQKFRKFILSVKRHSGTNRVNRFARMMCVLDEGHNYNIDETKQYLAGMEYLQITSTLGSAVTNNDTEKRVLAPWIRGNEYIRIFGEKRLRAEELTDFRKECEKLRINDPSGRNIAGLIDVDVFMEKIIIKYRSLIGGNRDHWCSLFKAADLDSKMKLSYKEFFKLFRFIESDRFDEKKIEDIFVTNCDLIENDDIALSLQKFLALCFEFDLFGENKSNTSLGVSSSVAIEKLYKDFVTQWPDHKLKLQQSIEMYQSFIPDSLCGIWLASLAYLEIMTNEVDLYERRGTLIKFRLLQADINSIEVKQQK